ncbi:cell shape-determining protein [Clostridium sp. DL1XJH146]
MKKKVAISLAVLSLFLALISWYLFLPVLSLSYFGTVLLILIVFIPISISLGLSNKKIVFYFIIPLIIFAILLFNIVMSTGIVNSSKKRAMIGQVEEKDFSTDIVPIDVTQIPVVDQELAQNLGDKKLGEQVALGSQVTLGEFTQQNVDGKLYWVAPLLHSGFFKWNGNKDGTPGYIMISATNQQDIKLIQEVDGKKIKIKYQPNAFFGSDLARHVYMSGYKKIGLTDYSFELDDEDRPFWVITKYKNNFGFGGSKAEGVIIVDAENGDIEDYDLENIPQWVDRVIPANFVMNQLDDWGRYINGWWNPSNKDELQTTKGYNIVYNDGECFYYTGMTSAGSDESTIGFMLINTRTKETNLYRVSGTHEIAAMQSAEGQVQNLEYTATFPILINVDGQATYFTTLKDKKGLVKLYAMVNVKDYSMVGVGESLSKTKSNYIKKLKNQGDWQGLQNSGDENSEEGTIKRIGSSIIDDTTYYYMVTNENPNKIFIASLNMSNELPLTKEGDRIKITYFANENSSIDLSSFDNVEFNQ